MSVASVTRSDTRDGKGEAQRDMGGVPVRSEADFASNEALETTQQGVSARFPCPPDSQRSLSGIDVACPLNPVFSVFFVSTVAAIAADDAIKSGSDCFHGVHGFDQDPNLDHVSGLSIVRRSFEARRDDDPLGVFVDDITVAHREPPRVSMRATSAMMSAKPKAASGPWKRGGMRRFMMFWMLRISGAWGYHAMG